MEIEDVTHSYWNSVQLTYCFDSIACTDAYHLPQLVSLQFTVTCANPGEADDAFSLLLYFFCCRSPGDKFRVVSQSLNDKSVYCRAAH